MRLKRDTNGGIAGPRRVDCYDCAKDAEFIIRNGNAFYQSLSLNSLILNPLFPLNDILLLSH
jgi:hypothetical protein